MMKTCFILNYFPPKSGEEAKKVNIASWSTCDEKPIITAEAGINYNGEYDTMGNRGPKPKFIAVACPNDSCSDIGKTGFGNIVGNGTYHTKSGMVRKYICKSCGKVFCDRTNTAFFNLRTKDEKVLIALKMIINGTSLRSVAEILNVKLDTVRGWLHKAAEHSEEVNKILLKGLNVSRVELDELWTFVTKKQFREWKNMKMMHHADISSCSKKIK